MFVQEKYYFAVELSLREISLLCTCTRSFARPSGAKIVRNKDAQFFLTLCVSYMHLLRLSDWFIGWSVSFV